ncbi:MAG: hypothetical protein M1548_05790, partial [Actinobacteria bacterium]|nr:hypothetical protein [Actinomycetota bacterium]
GRLCVNLGIFWALIAGAIAGVIIDHSPIMMFLAGAMGPAFLEGLIGWGSYFSKRLQPPS